MKTDHRCGRVFHVADLSELSQVFADANDPIIIGGGSNILFTKDTDRDLIVIEIAGIQVTKYNEDNVQVHIGAGEDWHQLVMWAIEKNYGGIENLSLIPGKCGAAPMQNIGAYGVEIKDVLSYVDVFHLDTKKVVRMSNQDCEFGYRESIFKSTLKDKVVITAIGINLTKDSHHNYNTSYGAIQQELEKKVVNISLRTISDAVIAIRQSKLPDPKLLPNSGSFFKNPIISVEEYAQVLVSHPDMPSYPVNDKHVKVPAGWLIDQAGWKGKRAGDAGIHEHQALVIVNHGKATGPDILSLADKVGQSVQDRYGITIQPEVNTY